MKNTTTIKNIVWKFKDSEEAYPELKGLSNIKISEPSEVYKNFRFLFENEVKEKFIVFWLSSANSVIGFETITEGILNASLVHPREVFRGAIVSSCASIIIAHNHPSGNPEPSNEDITITKKLVEAGKIIDINVFDHIIFINDGYTSFVEKWLM